MTDYTSDGQRHADRQLHARLQQFLNLQQRIGNVGGGDGYICGEFQLHGQRYSGYRCPRNNRKYLNNYRDAFWRVDRQRRFDSRDHIEPSGRA